MPLMRRYVKEGVTVAVWEITETLDELLAQALPAERVAVAAFASEKRKCEWLAVRLLLRGLLSSEASIEYDSNGKPFLVGVDGFISVSHTTGFAALAFSQLSPVGLDIELADRVVGASARRFMFEEELSSVPVGLWNNYKLLRWTTAEALFKLVGNLGGSYRENIVLHPFMLQGSGKVCLSIVGINCEEKDFTAEYLFDENLLLTLCRKA